jgi:GT2 family glycosyltransferase
LEIVQGYIKRFISPDSPTPPNFVKGKDETPVFALHLGAGLFKKSVFEKIGLMDESMKYSEDIDWFLRAIENQVSIAVSNEIVYFYRAHQTNMTHNTNQTNLYMLKACKKSLDRRRKANPKNPEPLPNIKNPDELIKLLNDSEHPNTKTRTT